MQVIEAIQLEVPIEAVYLAEEIKVQAPDILEAYRAHFPDIEFQFLPHVPDFDQLVGTCKGAVRSGQFYRHAPNCVLKIGCVY